MTKAPDYPGMLAVAKEEGNIGLAEGAVDGRHVSWGFFGGSNRS